MQGEARQGWGGERPLGSHPDRPPAPPGSLQNVNELNQWLSALRKASAPNPDKLAACHPGAFRSSRWTCCLQAERSGEGAGWAQVPPSPPADQQLSHLRLAAVQPGASYLTSVCLSLLKREMGLMTVPASWGWWEDGVS